MQNSVAPPLHRLGLHHVLQSRSSQLPRAEVLAAGGEFWWLPPSLRVNSFASSAPASSLSLAAAVLGFAAAVSPMRRRDLAVRRRGAAQVKEPTVRVREPPTPFPRDKLFPQVLENLLRLLLKEKPNEEQLLIAIEEVQDEHEYNMQWMWWPKHIQDAKYDVRTKGCFQCMRGLVSCVENGSEPVRIAAVSLILSLLTGGTNNTRVPVSFAVECGVVKALCLAAREDYNAETFAVIRHIAVTVPTEMLSTVIKGGAIDAAVELLEAGMASPMDQLAALDLLMAMAKRAPAKTAEAGAYDVVKLVSNPTLVPRCNKIMNFLRPLVEHEGDGRITTNIRIGGLRF